MKITAVDVLTLYYEYPEGQSIRCAEGVSGSRTSSLVRVRVDEGLEGVGSAYSHPDLVQLIVEGHLAPFLVGSDPADVEGLWERMYSLTRWYGRKGAAISALGAVDTALWDLRGKVAGRPVYELLGGTAGEAPAYASGLLWQEDLDVLVAEALAHADDGFGLMKMRLGGGLAYDRRAVDAVLDAVDGRARLAVDGTHRYSAAAAVELGRDLAERGVAWFEEPFPPEDVDAYAALRAQVDVPIAAGENEFGVQGFRELFRVGAVDVAQPDAARAGGISECWRIAQLAGEHGVTIATHGWSDAIAVTANAHLVAAAPNGAYVEVDRTGTPLMDGLLAEPLRFEQGRLQLSGRPGLGIELDPEVVAALALPRGARIPPGNYADLLFGDQAFESVPPYAATSYP
jgi:L-alanine-DL-glutamate epimerase-like enolase superfamily enzyme